MDGKEVNRDEPTHRQGAEATYIKKSDDYTTKGADNRLKHSTKKSAAIDANSGDKEGEMSNLEKLSDLDQTLSENGLDKMYWRDIFKKKLRITSVSQIKYLGIRDFISIQGHCRYNWEKQALKKLLCGEKNQSHAMEYEDWNKRERSDQNRYDEMKSSVEQTLSETKSHLPKSEDWITASKNVDLNKTLDNILPKSTFIASSISRQQLDEISILKNASAGMAVRGLLVENSNIKNTNAVVDIIGEVCMMAPQIKQSEKTIDFSTRQKHDEYHHSIEIFAARGKVSFKAGNFLDFGLSNLYITEKDDKSSLHSEEVFHSRVQSAFIPVKAIELKLENFIFVPNALKSLKVIEQTDLERNEFDKLHVLFVQFFKKYGSHVNVGILHFGGIYEWTAKYESEHKSKETFSVDILNDVFDAYLSGRKLLYNKYVGGRISGNVIKKEIQIKGNYDESELSKVFCSVSQYGGPPEAGDFQEWKSRMTSENSTWNIIDRGEFIEVWKILSNHQTDFKDYSRLFKLMEVSFHIDFVCGITTSNIQQCNFKSVLLTFQRITKVLCQDICNKDYIIEIMNLKCVQDLFSNMIFITKTSTDESFVSEVRLSMETIVKYMKNVDNQVKKSIVSWIGDPNWTQTISAGIITAENIQDVKSFYSALKDKLLPFIQKHRTRRTDEVLNEYVMEELTSVCVRLLSNLKTTNVFYYAILLSQLQILNYDVKNYSFPHFEVFDDLLESINALESCIEDYRMQHSHSVNEQAFVVSVVISNMQKYNVSNKETVFDQCLNPVMPILHHDIVEILKSCTESIPYKWSLMRYKINLLTKEDDFHQYHLPVARCNEQINQIGVENRLFRLSKSAKQLLGKLGLEQYFPNKIDFIDVISLSSELLNEINLRSLHKRILNDIMMVNRVARDHNLLKYLKMLKTTGNQSEDDNEESDDDDDDYDEEEDEDKDDINPLDMLVAIFYCSSYTLQKVLADKLFSCCIALPFVFPPNESNELILLLGTLRAIIVNVKSESILYQKTAVDIPCHVLSFIRLGRPNFSKSAMINKFMSSVDCDIFYNHDCPLGTTKRDLSNGLVELSLFPTLKTDFMFALNLRGDGFEFQNSVRMLCGISSVVVVCLEAEHLKNAQSLERLNVINNSAKGVVLAIDGNSLKVKEIILFYKEYKKMLLPENQNKTSIVYIRSENKQRDLSKSKDTFQTKITKLFKDQPTSKMIDRINNLEFDALFVDENSFDLSEKENASFVLLHLPNNFEDMKQTILPLQTSILPDIAANFKKMHSACIEMAFKKNDIRQELLQLREKQLQIMCNLDPFMTTFINMLLCYKDKLDQLNKFVVLVKSYLDDRCRDSIQLQKLQKVKYKGVLRDRCRPDSKQIVSVIGYEHLMREVAQIFEACSALKSQCEKNTWNCVSKFPGIAARLLLKGQPIEVMDGDTGYVPLGWIKAIFNALGKQLGDKKCLVLSIIGIQSTGKSTLLNTMFGLTFPVCAGRCTKGVFMQIVPITRNDFQYILVLDTEGLRAPTKGNDMNKFDNEIATFAIGLADINIVNIKGESTSEMKEVMSMAICSLLRLKLGNQNINIHQTCLFVHQNVSAENAYEMTEQERNILISELDALTSAAAEHINNYEIKKISDVINFDPHENVCYIPDLWAGVDTMKYISSGYSVSVSKLKEKIMKFASCDRSYLPFSNLILRVHDIWTGILGDSFVFEFSSSLSIKANDDMIKQFLELKWNLHRTGENELNQAENLLLATNNNYLEFAENMKSTLYHAMKTEERNHMIKFNEFINKSDLKHLMKHWRLIITEKLQTEQEKIIWTLQKDYEKLIERVKLKREQSLRQTEYEDELMMMVKNFNEEERKNEYDLERKFDEHWTRWCKKLIPGLHTPLPNLKELLHRLVNESCDDKMRSYVKEYMSYHVNDRIKSKVVLFGSLTFEDIDISVLNVNEHRNYLFKKKYKEEDCKKDALLLINIIFSEIDVYLGNTIKSVSQFENRFALTSFSFISKNIDTFQSDKFTLSPKFHAMLLSHVAIYLMNYFTRVHKKEEENQKNIRNKQKELMYQFRSNITESDNAANYFLKALAVGIEEHVSTKISGKIADFIVKEFSHSKLKLIKTILLDLAKFDQFHLFKMYIDEPRDFAYFWTRWYTDRKIFAIPEGTTLTLYGKMTKELSLEVAQPLKSSIITASKSYSKSLQNKSSWIDTFTQEMMKAKVFPLKPENVQFIQNQVTDFEYFSKALLEKLDGIEHDVFNVFSKTTEKDVEWKECPYDKILDQLWGCDAKCPFCSETCIHSNQNHLELGEKHKCWMHRPQGIGDMKVTETRFLFFKREVLEVENCNYLIGTPKTYEKPRLPGRYKFSNFRNDYIDWDIQADSNTRPEYWMWFFCEYGHNLEMVNGGVKLPIIPENRKVKKDIAIESLGSDESY